MSDTTKPLKQPKTQTLAAAASTEKKRGKQATRVVVKYDAGFGNAFYIRGQGANLRWDRGVLLHNIQADEWVWETDLPFNSCEFKVLLNDMHYELGENHYLKEGSEVLYTPRF